MSASETSGNQCEHGVDVGAYALGALDEHEVEPFRAHLETCAECREELAQLQGVTDSLAIAVPHAQPSADLRGRLMATVRAEAELLRATGHEADRPVRARSVWRWRVLPGLVAAGALAAADFRRLVVLILFLFDRFVQVVVISHHPGQQEQGNQQRDK